MRRLTRQVNCGKVQIGGNAPISIQSMTNTDTMDVVRTLEQIESLAQAGCQIVRIAVTDSKAVVAFGKIKAKSSLPLVADIHFDYKLAIAAIENGADKIRINPGNIGSKDKFRMVLEKAKQCKIPIRIGVNSGSLEKELYKKYGGVTPEALCESALNAVAYAQSFGFYDLIVSLKSSDVPVNHMAHKLFSQKSNIPLHIGLTEAGIAEQAKIKSSIAIGALLLEGIGDTIRVSLTGDPLQEVVLARQILEATGTRRTGIDFVSCPTCARTKVDLASIASLIKEELEPLSLILAKENKFLRVAVMGCEVNGPGEARHADLGVACGKGIGLIMENGLPIKTVPENQIVQELTFLINKKIVAK